MSPGEGSYISSMYFHYFCCFHPMERGVAVYLKNKKQKTCIPLIQECIVPTLVEIGSVVSEKSF